MRVIWLLFYVSLAPLLFGATLIKQVERAHGSSYYKLFDEKKQCVGTIAAYEIPFARTFVVHSFYVPPEHRGHGYGSQTLSLLLNDYIQQGYKIAYLQVGPYEKSETLDKNSQDYHERVLRLRKFYAQAGFQQASWLERCAVEIFYPYLRIDLPSEDLLRRTFW